MIPASPLLFGCGGIGHWWTMRSLLLFVGSVAYCVAPHNPHSLLFAGRGAGLCDGSDALSAFAMRLFCLFLRFLLPADAVTLAV